MSITVAVGFVMLIATMGKEFHYVVSFFQGDVAGEGLYADILNARNRYFRKARRLTDRMWSSCGQFVDADPPDRARKDDFYPVWWELYLAYALSNAGVQLVPRRDRPRCVGKGHPDLLTSNPRVWIEAVMPQAGIGADALSEPPSGGVFDVPLDDFVLRLATAIQEKVTKLESYIKNGTISSTDATVIAVSGGRLPFRFTEYAIPNIVRSVCGVGFVGVQLDVLKRKRTGAYVEFRNHVQKKSTAKVPTDLFLRKESAHVSAVLYSSSDCVNYPRRPGAEFILVHNSSATVPLADTWLPRGCQYWIKNGELRSGAAISRTA